ncbi:MAG: AraC family transcriptional regulator [Sphingobium sp.]
MNAGVVLGTRRSQIDTPSAHAMKRGPTMRGEVVISGRPILAPWQVQLATQVMRRSIGGAISVAHIASLCRLSLSHFVRAFTNTVGIAPYAWFVQQRISQAKHLLCSTALPLAQIALECGFSDQAHFTKGFAKSTGLTPARWRRQILWDRRRS